MNHALPEPDPKHPDMSPEAIDQRLRHLGQIYKLARSLRNAKWLGSSDKISKTDQTCHQDQVATDLRTGSGC